MAKLGEPIEEIIKKISDGIGSDYELAERVVVDYKGGLYNAAWVWNSESTLDLINSEGEVVVTQIVKDGEKLFYLLPYNDYNQYFFRKVTGTSTIKVGHRYLHRLEIEDTQTPFLDISDYNVKGIKNVKISFDMYVVTSNPEPITGAGLGEIFENGNIVWGLFSQGVMYEYVHPYENSIQELDRYAHLITRSNILDDNVLYLQVTLNKYSLDKELVSIVDANGFSQSVLTDVTFRAQNESIVLQLPKELWTIKHDDIVEI